MSAGEPIPLERGGWVNVQAIPGAPGPEVSWVPTTDQRAAERSKDSEQESIIRAFYSLQQPEAGTETAKAITDLPTANCTPFILSTLEPGQCI